jgi:DNA invertase Pin-like site-specific DNA recombinase
MEKAIGYIRVSKTDDQSLSLTAQRSRIEAYAALRGLTVVAFVVDDGISGATPFHKRSGGARVLAAIKRKETQHVLALRLDRLFRNCVDCLQVTSTWDKGGVAFHLIDLGGQTFDTSSPMGRFFLTVMAGVAELERNLISDRTKAALSVLRSQGKRNSRFAPFGFRHQDGQLVPHEAERALVPVVRDLKQQGYGIRRIAAALNAAGHRTRSGQPFVGVQIQRILREVGAV